MGITKRRTKPGPFHFFMKRWHNLETNFNLTNHPDKKSGLVIKLIATCVTLCATLLPVICFSAFEEEPSDKERQRLSDKEYQRLAEEDLSFSQRKIRVQGEQLFIRPIEEEFYKAVIPDTYKVSIGDEYILSFQKRNRSANEYGLTVLPSGELLLPYIGVIDVKGMSLKDLTEKVRGMYHDILEDYDVSFLLMSPGGFEVSIMGAVESPGYYNINSLTRLSSAISLAGGLTKHGSLRNVQVTKEGETKTYDLFMFFHTGSPEHDPFLSQGTTVFIPIRSGVVSIAGEVYRPGNYEIMEDETISNLISYANGLTRKANPHNVTLERFMPTPAGDKPYKLSNINLKDIQDGKAQSPELKDWDKVTVFSYAQTKGGFVDIKGEIRNPDSYELSENMRVSDLVNIAGGVTNNANLPESVLVTTAVDGRVIKKLDLAEILADKNNPDNLVLKANDVLYINQTALGSGIVHVSGRVKTPGNQYIVNGETAYEAIMLSGGIDFPADEDAEIETDDKESKPELLNLENSVVIRTGENGEMEEIPLRLDKIIFENDRTHDFPVQNGDRIIVASKPDMVFVNGLVENPGEYDYRANSGCEYYARQAGLLSSANLNGARVFRQDSSVYFCREATIFPGDTIYIPETRSVKRKRDVQEYTSILSSVLLIYNILK